MPAQVGNFGVSVVLALTGVAAASSVGSVGVTESGSASLSGVQTTTSVGNISASAGATVSLTGVSSTSAVGTLGFAKSGSIAIIGVNSTGSVGSVGFSESGSAVLTGNEATGSVGSVVASSGLQLPITGVESASDVGSFGVTKSGSVGLIGNESTGQVGFVAATGGDIQASAGGGHFLPGLVGVKAGKKRKPQKEIELAIDTAITEVLQEETREEPIKRVSRGRKDRIIRLASEQLQADIGKLEVQALSITLNRVLKERLKSRRVAKSLRIVDSERKEAIDNEQAIIALLILAEL